MQTLWTWLTLAWLAMEILVALITRTRRGGGKVQDRGSMLLLWVVIVLSITACSWMREALRATALYGVDWLRPLALVILIAGLVLRITAIFNLGRHFSANVAIRAEQTVQRTGLYAIVRHPSYLGLLMIFLAIGLHARNWASLLAAIVPTTLALLYRIHIEEQALHAAFGDEYGAYCRVTKRLIPGVF